MALIVPKRKNGFSVADVFSTTLYSGNGSTQTITNDIDLAGEGGLVIGKRRDVSGSGAVWEWVDTERGAEQEVASNGYEAGTSAGDVSSFLSDGYGLTTGGLTNVSGSTNVSYTIRKSPSFFDIVTYTGTGSARTIAHNLGSVPGLIIVKCTSFDGHFCVYHRANTGAPQTDYLFLNLTSAGGDSNTYWNDTQPTDSVFSVGTSTGVNGNSRSYVAYLFAHDTSDEGMVQCGSYTANGSTSGPVVTLGWEPQFLLIKLATGTANWGIIDNQRVSGSSEYELHPNVWSAESAINAVSFTSTGFQIVTADSVYNSSGSYVYMAIRKEGT